jgi:DNA-3-methyladenine glycosylase
MLDGEDLLDDRLFIVPASAPAAPIVVSTRIGITRSVDLPWRFYLHGNPSVSRRDPLAEREQLGAPT